MSKTTFRIVFALLISLVIVAGIFTSVHGAALNAGARGGGQVVDAGLIGGGSNPGDGWGSMLFAYEDLFILQYRHLKRETVPFCDGHVESLRSNILMGPNLPSGKSSFERFYRDKTRVPRN